ncbi:TonB-dependent receptor [Hymenobacter sp. H14-R3]|uniref:outer membrane beta-barrel protein n=1 Tax=Hymenobacter sp. H14-R3 TaxID=3046308 RepID=UPI0024B8DC04|nr:outer membrane beta-barrel protein [Hymenobacter sp. H14-R3]MDJ0365805.1 TonB-dependent receptor [Hymenobacter sp. H14-R3]
MTVLRRCLLLPLLALALLSRAQTPGPLTGRLLDAQQHPVPFATVLLRQVRDTTWVRDVVAQADGRFTFGGVGPGQYRLTVVLLGYQPYRSAPLALPGAAPGGQLPAIYLAPATRQLKGVEVVGQKPLLEMQPGKMVLNVAASPTAAGATALEILQKIPGLVLQNNRLSLAGREGLTILLDGRTTHYTDVVSVLRDFPGSSIDRVEVLTQPGAAYEAAGSAGILNIILKKNANLGTNGTVTGTAGYGRFGKAGAALDLNHRTRQGLNVFGNYGYNYRRTYEQLNTDRLTTEAGQAVTYAQRSYQPRTVGAHTARVGADLPLTRRQTLGVLLSGYAAGTQVEYENRIDVTSADKLLATTTRNDNQRRTTSYAANLHYKLALDSAGRELLLDADYSRYRAGTGNILVNNLSNSTIQQLRFNQQTAIGLRSAKADYHQPLGRAKLAAGAKISAATISSQLDFAELAAGGWQPVPGRSDQFQYAERLAAGYLSLARQWGGVQLEAGLRGEQTHSAATSVALARTVARDYFQLFPSLSVTKELTKKLGANLSYGRRIDRPGYQDLNPSIIYLDPYSRQQGNPFLKPELTSAYRAALTYQQQPVLSLAYNRTSDAISLVTAQPDSILYSTTTNLGRLDNYSATLNFPLSLGQRVSGYGGVNTIYNQYNGQYLGGEYRGGRLSAIVYLQSTVRLPQGVRLEVSGFYHSGGVNGLIAFRPFGSASLGLQKAFCHDQLQLRLAATDVFFTNQQRGTVRYQNMDLRFLTQSETRQLRLSLAYSFGNQKLTAARKHATGLDDERSRVKTDRE